MQLEQAVFTSIRSQRLDGYQLAAVSPGIDDATARELAVWGPAHDSLTSSARGAASINFHPLGGGQFCISKTARSGGEYSQRGGGRIYTQMLVVPREGLHRFACDPFLVLRAAEASGRLVALDTVPQTLPTLRLLGRGAPDPRLTALPQPLDCAAIEQAAADVRQGRQVALVSELRGDHLVRAVLNSLEEEQRLSVSFTTGLRYTPRRPFRLMVLPPDPVLIRESQRGGYTAVDMALPSARPAALAR